MSKLEHVSKTDLKCAWSSTKGSVKEKYKAVPTSEMSCVNKISHIDLTPADSEWGLEHFIKKFA